MLENFKPMLAGKVPEQGRILFPSLASPKLDGIRCVVNPNGVLTRSLKPIPNAFIRASLELHKGWHLDGELMTYNPDGSPRGFNEIQSDVMSATGQPDFQYLVFDSYLNPQAPFTQRWSQLRKEFTQTNIVRLIHQVPLQDADELDKFEEAMLSAGFEGVMLRHPNAPYKFGRSTTREAYLLKLKRFTDDEAVFVGCEAMMHNANEATTNALGHTERSSAASGLVRLETMGVLIGAHPTFGPIEVGTGFTEAQRKDIWDNRLKYIGRKFTFKYQAFGSGNKPRLPVFKGWRDPRDMS